MLTKTKEKEKAIKLRKQGCSYSEILKEIPVAKSTLSLWLRDVGLSKKQKQRLTEKKLFAALRGAAMRKNQRLAVTKNIKDKARKEIGKLSKRDLWLIGISLYWAEGAKQKDHNVSQEVKIGNTDPLIIKIFLNWVLKFGGISKKDICFRILIHDNAKNKLLKIKKYWAKVTKFPPKDFQKVTWKKHKIRTNRKNIGESYNGLLEIKIKKSTNLNRKITGWIEGICEKKL